AAMGSVTVAAAEDDVMARIKPVGEVNVAGKAAAPAAAAAAADPGAALFQSKGCGGCHGADGKTTPMDTYPKIAGQSVEYLLAQMKDIKSGTRANGQTAMMKGIIAGVSEEEMKSIAEWLTKQ
ncbi:c-type cytochrome, partial [Thiolapillus sp.]|uniref:c-type cytochrome n=1 Tax=Thiolapillus sp. TaxID=2017437 RepID=UPI003AF66D51